MFHINFIINFVFILQRNVTSLCELKQRIKTTFNLVNNKKRLILKEGFLINKRKHLADDKFFVFLVKFFFVCFSLNWFVLILNLFS